MKLDINDLNQITTRILLNADFDTVKKVSETPEWVTDKTMVAQVIVNGVEIPAQAFEDFLHDHLTILENGLREKYDADNRDREIHLAAMTLLKKEASGVIDRLYDLTHALEAIDDVLVPYWEKVDNN